MKRKIRKMSIKHIVNDVDAGIYVSTDLLNKTITIGRGMKRIRLPLWKAERLEFLLKRQIDRLIGAYEMKSGGDNARFVTCHHCGNAEKSEANFCVISKKRWKRLEKKVADLEKAQSQQSIEKAQEGFEELIQKHLDNPSRLKF